MPLTPEERELAAVAAEAYPPGHGWDYLHAAAGSPGLTSRDALEALRCRRDKRLLARA
jgi:hypothetical protein